VVAKPRNPILAAARHAPLLPTLAIVWCIPIACLVVEAVLKAGCTPSVGVRAELGMHASVYKEGVLMILQLNLPAIHTSRSTCTRTGYKETTSWSSGQHIRCVSNSESRGKAGNQSASGSGRGTRYESENKTKANRFP